MTSFREREIPQEVLCRQGQHDWAGWNTFVPVRPGDAWVPIPSKPPTNKSIIEAYRWRYCKCGAGEREAYVTHERTVFEREDLG